MKSRNHSLQSSAGLRSAPGFSLVELLAVIIIMAILLTVGAIGVGGLTGGKSVSSAVANTEALFAEARALAIGKGANARVLIDVDDPADRQNYLKRVVIVHEEINPTTGEAVPDSWVLSSRGYVLPDQVYFSQAFSQKSETSGELDEMTLTSGPNVNENYAGKYLYYEFTPEGICRNPGASFIIGSGVRTGTNDPIVTGSAKKDFGGFVVWRNGTTTLFRSPAQMDIPDSVTNF